MGLVSSISNLLSRIFTSPKKLFITGLDNAGKTTLLYQLKLGEMVQTIPTVGFNVETVKCKNLTFTLWDAGGSDKIRPLWRYYYQGSNAGIFVFDSTDRYEGRGKHAAEILHKFSSEIEEYDIPLLIFANKQDCEGAMGLEEIQEILHPHDLRQKNWHIQLCSAKTREGLYEGLEWIGRIVCSKK